MPSPPLLIALALLSGEPSLDMKLVEELYSAGQEHIEQADFAAAAKDFEALMKLVPESEENRPIRESVALNLVNAYLQAYRRQRNADGGRRIEYIHKAQEFKETYEADLQAAYGNTDGFLELAILFERVEEELTQYEFPPCLGPCLSPLPPAPGCGGRNNDPGLAAALLLPLGLRRRRDVFERIADALPTDIAARVRSKIDDE